MAPCIIIGICVMLAFKVAAIKEATQAACAGEDETCLLQVAKPQVAGGTDRTLLVQEKGKPDAGSDAEENHADRISEDHGAAALHAVDSYWMHRFTSEEEHTPDAVSLAEGSSKQTDGVAKSSVKGEASSEEGAEAGSEEGQQPGAAWDYLNKKPEKPSSTPHSVKECQDFCGWRTNVNLCIWSCKKALSSGLIQSWASSYSDPYDFGNIAKSWVLRADPVQTWWPNRGGVAVAGKQMGGRWPTVAKGGNEWFSTKASDAAANVLKLEKFGPR